MIQAGLWKAKERRLEEVHGWRPRRSAFGDLSPAKQRSAAVVCDEDRPAFSVPRLSGDRHRVARLRSEYRRLQIRIDAMCLDNLDGRIDTAFLDTKSAAWRRHLSLP